MDVYEDCGEAVGYLEVGTSRPEEGDELRAAVRREDPAERANLDAANRARSARRAKTRLRRLATANALVYLWTLTFEVEPADRSAVVIEVQKGMKRLLRACGRFGYVWVIEKGSNTGRLHVHFMADRYLDHAAVRDAWGLGHVWVSKKGGRGGSRANALANARYLAKYVGKEMAGGIDGRQAYGRSEGLGYGRVVRRRRLSERDALWVARAILERQASAPLVVSYSGDWADYEGPPAWWASVP